MWRGREVPRKCSNLNKTTGAAPAASFSRWEDFQRSLRNFANKMLCCWSCARLSYIPPSRWRTLAFSILHHTEQRLSDCDDQNLWPGMVWANVVIVRAALVSRLTNGFFTSKVQRNVFKVEFTFSQYLAAQCRIAREEEWMKCHQSLINVIKWARAGVAVAVAGEKSWNSEDTLAVVTNLREIQKYRIILSGCPKAAS